MGRSSRGPRSDTPLPPYRRTVAGVLGGLVGLVALSIVAGLLVVAPMAPVLALSGHAATGAISLFEALPGYLAIDRLMLPTTIYARDPDTGDDVELTSFYDQNRVPVSFNEVAVVMYDAMLSSEDPRYYEHGGVDIIGTTRAIVRNAQGGQIQGGSSISQQYVKNVLVQRCERDAVATETETRDEVLRACWTDATDATDTDGYQRKLQEIRYAIQLERKYSKNDILLGYLNIANFGGTTYGIEAAARYYFDTTSAELTLEQAATLAGMVQNPNTFRIDRPGGSIPGADGATFNKKADGSVDDVTPGTLAGLDTLLADGTITQEQYLAAGDAYSATKGRQLYVLDRMREDGRITPEQYVAAAVEPIAPVIHPARVGCVSSAAPFFCQYVVNTVRSDPDYADAFGTTIDERDRALTRDGLNIYTTLDWRLQKAAQNAMHQYAPEKVAGMSFGSASVSIEATTGRILAISQNNRFTEDRDLAASDSAYTSLVYAGDTVHGASDGFSVGSTFKLFTLIDWLEKGKSLNESVNGRLRAIPRLADRCDGPWVNLENHVVRNFGGVGGYTGTPMAFTAQSLNTGYLGMAEQLDLCDIEGVVARLGVTRGTGQAVDLDGAASIIGTANIAPVALASAYATVANKGVRCAPRAIERVVNADGEELPVPGDRCSRAISAKVAAAAAFALQGVMRPGGTGSLANPGDGAQLIGKTGTHEQIQTWLVSSNTRVTTAVWAGNSRGTANVFRTWHNGMTLSNLRFVLSRDIQSAVDRVYPGGTFPAPPTELLRRPYVPPPTSPSPDDSDDRGPDDDRRDRGGGRDRDRDDD
ncbi:membrane peptidoglycan carboxypeptidase [Microbacterium terrae]|uniref:Penicillin-binding protein 1F n=1 Tax=Microbacterium terrae TaxID=69369 RepID=A0A0M2H3S2_9MICO|nr:transglycosylase domain-containing protein [Microbacterium terrae]KJL38341.1 Penicillin-binding protein 1F [Microbacterium terrae]MBP1079018.1 membrane peptidoglycan carboxypeptidase [Microbacterium terrae]GLJ98418.1 carboxypeptidase [Microbacterium terrae]